MRVSDNQETQKHSTEFTFCHVSDISYFTIDENTPQYILDAMITTTERYRCFHFKISESDDGVAYIEGFDRGIEYKCETKTKMYDVLKALIETRNWVLTEKNLVEAYEAIESLNIAK